MAGLEILTAVFAAVSAANDAIALWRTSRDVFRAAEVFDEKYSASESSPEAKAAAKQFIDLLPGDLLDAFAYRLDECKNRYRYMLNNEKDDTKIDKGTAEFVKCICRELSRIKKTNGNIPDKWTSHWDTYSCGLSDPF
jgi:hypothetical protein